MANKNITQLTPQTGSANTTSLLYAVTGGNTDTSLPLTVLFNSPTLTGTPIIPFTQSGTGAVARTVTSKLQDFVNVLDFGAGAGGDVSLAFQEAVNALPSAGGTVYVPAGTFTVNTAPTWSGKSIYWHIDPAAVISGTQTTFPRMATNTNVPATGPWIQSSNPTVAPSGDAYAVFAVESIQPSSLNGGTIALYAGAQCNSSGANSIATAANLVATALAGSSGNIWGTEIDIGKYVNSGTQFGISLNGLGTYNPTYGMKIQRADSSLWQQGIDIRNYITGINIETTTGATNPLVVGTPISAQYPGQTIQATQIANSGSILLLQRYTNTSPTGYYINAINATNTGQLFSVDMSGNVIAAGTLQVTGAITPSSTAGIVGTTAANNASAGSVGEVISSVVSTNTAFTTTATAQNLTSITLTAGDWDVWGNVFFNGQTGAATYTNCTCGFNTTSATQPANLQCGILNSTAFGSSTNQNITVPSQRFNVSTSTTVYLVGLSTFSAGTMNFQCQMFARRRR